MTGSAGEEPKGRAAEFARKLQEIYGDDLRSVVLYGSAARNEYRPGISDLNILVILRELELDHLRRAAGITGDWLEAGNPPPLMMSEREWRGSADVFPLEYTDIRDGHMLLEGTDPFEEMRIEREHLRLQVEHELRAKKIQLREGYLVAGGSPDQLGRLLIRSLPTFLTLFRATLRLSGRPVPRGGSDLISAAASEIGFRAEPVIEVLRAREAPEGFEASMDGTLAAGYLEAVERSVEWLDRFEPDTGGSPAI
jgi:predicted nucleotidyltransferase